MPKQPLKRYLRFHFEMLLLALGFYGYSRLTRLIFGGRPPFECLMRDGLRLYCPFCGGTRTFLALLKLDFKTVLLSNPACLAALLFALVLDVRALCLILKKSEKKAVPSFVLKAAVGWFLFYTWLRNVLLFFGVDPLGDLSAYYAGFPIWRALLASLAGGVLGIVLFFTATKPGKFRKKKLLPLLLSPVALALLIYLPH